MFQLAESWALKLLSTTDHNRLLEAQGGGMTVWVGLSLSQFLKDMWTPARQKEGGVWVGE